MASNAVKSDLQSRLREAMEAENVNVDKYVFQLELEEETMGIQEKKETQCSTEVVLTALKALPAQLKMRGVHMSSLFKKMGDVCQRKCPHSS